MKPLPGRPSATARPAQGFTIIELMIGIAIAGILSAIALPNFFQMINNQRVRSAASDIHGSLLIARSEAMKRNTTVSLTAVDSADWAKGWTVGVGGTVFQTQGAFNSNVVITGPASGTVTYLSNGRPNTATRNATPPLLKAASSANSTSARCFSLSLTGMPETTSC